MEQIWQKMRLSIRLMAVIFLCALLMHGADADLYAQDSANNEVPASGDEEAQSAEKPSESSPEDPAKLRELRKEKQIKAAFLFNFLKFIEWPNDYEQNKICFLRENTFGEALTPLTKKRVRGKPIVILENVTLSQIAKCNILFIEPAFEKNLDTVLLDVYLYPILTVSDMKHFAFKGGVIGFYNEKKRVRFAINTSRAERLGLKMSSKLLELARIVE